MGGQRSGRKLPQGGRQRKRSATGGHALSKSRPPRLDWAMSDDDAKVPEGAAVSPGPKPGKEAGEERKERLAAALRQNLARRKSQGRARKSAGKGESGPPPGDER
jgi:hypothetical protein